MKWCNIKSLLRRAALVCIYWSLLGGPSSAQSVSPEMLPFVATPLPCDSIPCDSLLRQLPDSVVRRLARQLGMVDSAECRDAASRPTRYERNRARTVAKWMRLIPNQTALQYAGSIGIVSAGFGWHYGKDEHWETELLFGFVPRYHSNEAHFTFTIKQRYVPWHCKISSRWSISPLTTGIFFNTISGDDFWTRQPDRYPKEYYGFPTKLRTHIYLGQRWRYNIPTRHRRRHQAVSLYYELSSCDLYLVSKFTNHEYPWRETLSLGFGIRWEM